MKRYILIIPDNNGGSIFEADSMEEITAMICFGDKFTVVDKLTGATKDNHCLKIS